MLITQVQLEESNRKVVELTQLNGEMQGQVGTLTTTIRSLEGKVRQLIRQDTRRSRNVVLMLGQHHRRCPSNNTTFSGLHDSDQH